MGGMLLQSRNCDARRCGVGVIKDIVDIVVPRAQNRIADEGINIKDALNIELKEIGYIQKESNKNS